MRYGELITRSFTITWRHRYLWLLAILGGADAGSGGFGGSFGGLGNGRGLLQGTGGSPGGQRAAQLLQDQLGLVVAIVVGAVLVAIGLLLLSCVTTGALVRASAEHDAQRPFGHGMAWRAGAGTFWPILGLRLLALLWGLALVVVAAVLVVLGVVAFLNGQAGALAAVIAVGIPVFLTLVVASVVVWIVLILATRAVVLERRGPLAALGRGIRLLRERPGRVLVVWLLEIGLAAGMGVALAVAAVPLVLLAAGLVAGAAFAGGVTAAVVLGIPLAVVVAAVLVGVGMIGAYLSTYWTLAFRRMELEEPAPAHWPPQAYSPPAG